MERLWTISAVALISASLAPAPALLASRSGAGGPAPRAAIFQQVKVAAFSPDGRLFALGDSDKVVTVRDVETGKRLHTLADAHAGEVNALAFSPDGKTLASASDAEDDAIKLWDAATGREVRALRWSSKGGAKGAGRAFIKRVYSLIFSPDGKMLASAGSSVTYPYDAPQKSDPQFAAEVKLWDLAAGKVVRTLTAGEYNIYSAAFSPDGRLLVTGTGDDERPKKGVKVWEAATGKELRLLPESDICAGSRSISVSPDGRIVAASSDMSVRLWDLNSGRVLRSIDASGNLAFSPDGKLLATGGSDTDVWEVETGERVRELGGFSGGPNGVMFTPDGKTLLVAGAGKLRAWDLSTGRERSPAAEAGHDDKGDGGEFR